MPRYELWTCNGEAEILNSSSFGRKFSVLISTLFDPRHDPVTWWNFVMFITMTFLQ